MGGLHVTVRPEEAAQHADYVIVGEGDNVWGAVVRAAQEDVNANSDPQAPLRYAVRRSAGRAASAAQPTDLPHSAGRSRTFDSKDFPPVDVSKLPIPRYDLLDHRPYNRFTVQTSRGCPWRCDFCASTVMLSRRYRKRPVEHVIRDIEAIQDLRPHPFIEFADDNTFVDKQWGKDLCRRLIPLNVKWFTETDITVADDDELLVLMRDAGCRQVLIGLESPPVQGAGALQGIEMHANAKAKWAPRYLERLRKIQNHGITVNGCFILGLDGHGPEIFEQVLDFALEVPLFDVQITVLTPFPGTPLYDRLKNEGRLLFDKWWLDPSYRYGMVPYTPAGMTADEVKEGCISARKDFYRWSSIARRSMDRVNAGSLYMGAKFFMINYLIRREVTERRDYPLGDQAFRGELLKVRA